MSTTVPDEKESARTTRVVEADWYAAQDLSLLLHFLTLRMSEASGTARQPPCEARRSAGLRAATSETVAPGLNGRPHRSFSRERHRSWRAGITLCRCCPPADWGMAMH